MWEAICQIKRYSDSTKEIEKKVKQILIMKLCWWWSSVSSQLPHKSFTTGKKKKQTKLTETDFVLKAFAHGFIWSEEIFTLAQTHLRLQPMFVPVRIHQHAVLPLSECSSNGCSSGASSVPSPPAAFQSKIWKKTSLPPNFKHTLTLTHYHYLGRSPITLSEDFLPSFSNNIIYSDGNIWLAILTSLS